MLGMIVISAFAALQDFVKEIHTVFLFKIFISLLSATVLLVAHNN